MSEAKFELHFKGDSQVELVETFFRSLGVGEPAVAVRGKTAGAFSGAGSFQWTSAVRALCILCVRAALSEKDAALGVRALIQGYQGSLAASLDYAVSKQPTWLVEMCGVAKIGVANSRRLFVRSNPERKRPGPVIVAFNETILAGGDIRVVHNGTPLESSEELYKLLSNIPLDDDQEPTNPSETLLRYHAA
jgi:hypothetical protein